MGHSKNFDFNLSLFEEAKSLDQIRHKPASYTGIYGMHKYWAKKPYNIVRDFIVEYSKENEIVVDPFCGSGISISEAIFAGRKAVGIDINPSAIFITRELINKIPIKPLEGEFQKLESDIKDKIDFFYLIRRGDRQFIGTHFLWDNGTLTEVWYKKRNGRRKKVIETPLEDDLKLALSFSYETIPYYYPQNAFFHNPRINAHRENKIHHLFTPRNLMALALLMDRIEKIRNVRIREFFEFCFTASVGQASRMVFVIKRRGKFSGTSRENEKKEVGSWVIGYWIPKENFEINVWNCFENRYRRIVKAKKELLNIQYSIDEAKDTEELLESKNLLLVNDSAQNALRKISTDSVDYVITDPPHGNRQPYLELSMMWNSWLKKKVNYEGEIVISESKDRNKSIDNYYQLLKEVLKEIERILKPNHYFSLMFNSLDDETWSNLLTYLNKLNFRLEKIETLAYSANSVVQDTRGAGLKTDFILTFRKDTTRTIKDIESVSIENNKENIKSLITNYINGTDDNRLETYQILNFLVSDFLKEGKFFKISEILNLLKTEFQNKENKWTTKSGIQYGSERRV